MPADKQKREDEKRKKKEMNKMMKGKSMKAMWFFVLLNSIHFPVIVCILCKIVAFKGGNRIYRLKKENKERVDIKIVINISVHLVYYLLLSLSKYLLMMVLTLLTIDFPSPSMPASMQQLSKIWRAIKLAPFESAFLNSFSLIKRSFFGLYSKVRFLKSALGLPY